MSATKTSPWDLIRRRRLPARWRNPLGLIGAAIVAFAVFVAIFGDLIWTTNPNAPISMPFQGPSGAHPMGTDNLGRDMLARVIHGSQVSLTVAALAILIALVCGVTLGLVTGYFGGIVDLLFMRLIDMVFAFPGLVLAFVIAGLLGASGTNAAIAIGVVVTPAFARVVRASVLEVMGSPFIESARALGAGGGWIMRRHLLPNVVAPLTVLTTVYFSTAILSEATLSFLGLGVQPPAASWGNMLADARNYLNQSIWMSIFPGVAIMLVVMGFNFLGDGLRDALDPRIAAAAGDTGIVGAAAEIGVTNSLTEALGDDTRVVPKTSAAE